MAQMHSEVKRFYWGKFLVAVWRRKDLKTEEVAYRATVFLHTRRESITYTVCAGYFDTILEAIRATKRETISILRKGGFLVRDYVHDGYKIEIRYKNVGMVYVGYVYSGKGKFLETTTDHKTEKKAEEEAEKICSRRSAVRKPCFGMFYGNEGGDCRDCPDSKECRRATQSKSQERW